MKQFFILIWIVAAMFASAEAQTRKKPKPSTAEMLINYEKQTWELVKQKDLKAFANLIADDYYGIYPNAENVTKPMIVQFMNVVDLKDYQFSNIKVTMLNKNAAIITYQAEAHIAEKGKDVAVRVAITSGWAQRNGRWLGVFFRETPIV